MEVINFSRILKQRVKFVVSSIVEIFIPRNIDIRNKHETVSLY